MHFYCNETDDLCLLLFSSFFSFALSFCHGPVLRALQNLWWATSDRGDHSLMACLLMRKICWVHLSVLATPWAMSQQTDTSLSTRAALKCIVTWGLSSALFSSALQHPSSGNGGTPLKVACDCPCDMVIKKRVFKRSCMQSSHPMKCICRCSIVLVKYSGWPPEG